MDKGIIPLMLATQKWKSKNLKTNPYRNNINY